EPNSSCGGAPAERGNMWTQPLAHTRALQQRVARLERRELDGDARTAMNSARRLAAQDLYRVLIGVEVSLSIGFGACTFAENVERAEPLCTIRERRLHRLTEDERIAHLLNRPPKNRAQCRSQQRLRNGGGGERTRKLLRDIRQQTPHHPQRSDPESQQAAPT